ncbi:hypothetical protein IG193_07120 [Infirmifilum lucidum]|uniref:Uncharacterized protein n=1 Tax=Infirmifilum lucidum TaxID=2776706 RepID=A0A7L9FFL1_9CREN|nr:hypothetical protein [Infirmifilum lucidum]QOJ78519.1 hypothetical protein IG193_07120 [Infirmifilum lucidum]
MKSSHLIILVLWGLFLILVGLGVISGYDILPSAISITGLSLGVRAFSTPCASGKCPKRGFLLFWSLLLIEASIVIEICRLYSSLPLCLGVLVIMAAVSAYAADKKYSIL